MDQYKNVGHYLQRKIPKQGHWGGGVNGSLNFLDAIASPSTYPGRSVSTTAVSEWVMFSDFGDSYGI